MRSEMVMSTVFEGTSLTLMSLAVASVVYFMTRRSANTLTSFMNSLPIVGQKRKIFSFLRLKLASIQKSQEMAAEGYNLYTVYGKTFVLPSLGSGSAVILPSSKLELLNKPDNKIGAWKFQIDVLQPGHTIGSQKYYETTIQTAFSMVHKKLHRHAQGFAEMMLEELSAGCQQHFGTSQDWNTINVFDAVSRVTVRAANRILFGPSLSNNDEFLENLLIYVTSVFQSAGVISVLPLFMRSMFGPLLARKPKRYAKACKKPLLKMISQRIENTKAHKPVPDDLIQWLIQEYIIKAPECLDADHVSQSLLVLSIQSAFGTSFTLTNCIIDLYSSTGLAESIEGLREETSQQLFSDNTLSVGEAVNQLYRIDSCLRESMRTSSFSIVSLFRSVDAADGVRYDAHMKLPTGTRIGFPQQAIHHDDSFYPNPNLFDPFRFSRPFETYSPTHKAVRDSMSDKHKHEPVHHINQHFLTWGYGRHACPGRLFASNIMRLALSYIIEKYDIEGIPTRPPSKPMLNVTLPPVDTTIRVRWRGV